MGIGTEGARRGETATADEARPGVGTADTTGRLRATGTEDPPSKAVNRRKNGSDEQISFGRNYRMKLMATDESPIPAKAAILSLGKVRRLVAVLPNDNDRSIVNDTTRFNPFPRPKDICPLAMAPFECHYFSGSSVCERTTTSAPVTGCLKCISLHKSCSGGFGPIGCGP